ncbi:MAG: hypothetical protein A3F18_05455 [Legionellales bacterium RIFCSPHIGHO2_12_FULL_37_14]|nr:MAG: hypothetical protein A3F18_05455 [Legionellales bacterium RIFCSPHIGHO2_12_FULL_37_14]
MDRKIKSLETHFERSKNIEQNDIDNFFKELSEDLQQQPGKVIYLLTHQNIMLSAIWAVFVLGFIYG